MSVVDRTKAPEVTDFRHLVMPRMHTVHLSNGIPVHYLDNAGAMVCRISCVFDGGLAEAPRPTVARLAGALIQEGTRLYPGQSFAEEIDFNGARIGVTTEAHHTVVTAYTISSRAGDVIPMLASMILQPELPREAFRQKRQLAAQTAALNAAKVEYRAQCEAMRLAAGRSHPLARFDTASTIGRIPYEDVVMWRAVAYLASPHTMRIYAAGRIDDGIIRALDRAFGSMPPAEKIVRPKIVPMSRSSVCRRHIAMPDAMQNAVRIVIPAIPRSHPDYIPLRYAVMALGGYFGSRLMSNIREDKGYTYGISAHLLGRPEGSVTSIQASADPRFTNLLIDETFNEIRRLADPALMTSDELCRLRRYSLSTLASILDSPLDVADYHISLLTSAIPHADYFERQVAEANALSAEKIAEMTRKYLVPDNAIIVTAGK